MTPKVQKITPDPNCEFCNGDGVVYDSVPYGSTSVSMESYCGCVEEQANEDDDIVIVPYEPDPPYDHTGHDTLEEKCL